MIDGRRSLAMLSGCLRKGAWAVVEPADDCRFTFSAGLWSQEERRKADLRPVKFSVSVGGVSLGLLNC